MKNVVILVLLLAARTATPNTLPAHVSMFMVTGSPASDNLRDATSAENKARVMNDKIHTYIDLCAWRGVAAVNALVLNQLAHSMWTKAENNQLNPQDVIAPLMLTGTVGLLSYMIKQKKKAI